MEIEERAKAPARDEQDRYFLIVERDVGLFSLIQQVIANIPRALSEGRIPIVLFRENCSYYTATGYHDADTVWEYYFEPLVQEASAASVPMAVADRVMSSVQWAKRTGTGADDPTAREFHPEITEIGYAINERYYASEHFGDHPTLAGKALAIPWSWDDPSGDLRKITAPIIEQYIRPRPHILERVERFYAEHLAEGEFIGVQIRGTDSVSKAESRAFRSGALNPDAYIQIVEKLLFDRPGAKIFVATDAESSLDFMKERFGDRVVAFDSLRQGAGKAAGRGPLGGLMPAYLTESSDAAARNGEEAIIEYLLLCKSAVLVHNGASLARTVLLARPQLKHWRTNPPRPVRMHIQQFFRRINRFVTGDGTQLHPKGERRRFAPLFEHWRLVIGNYFEFRRDPNRPLIAATLWFTDRVRRVLLRNPHVLVMAAHNNEYLRKRRKTAKNVKPTMIEIRNDFDYNAGFCVQVQFVLAQLQEAELTDLEPVVNLDLKTGYYYDAAHGDNVWEYYFEPVGESSSTILDTIAPEMIIRYTPPTQANLCLGEGGHPRVEGPATATWYGRRRREGAEMAAKYLRVKPHIQSKVDDFYDREMKSWPVLGVQVRGTDKGFDPNGRPYGFPDYMARIVPPEEYYPFVDEFLSHNPDARIFVATDQQQFLEHFRERYEGRVLSFGDTRSTNNRNPMQVNDGRNYKKGEDVLIDVLLLSRTDFLLRCQSNVGEVATYLNPELPVIDVQYAREFQDAEMLSISDASSGTGAAATSQR